MIEKLLTSYREKLCAQEIMLVTNLYNASNDIKAAELLADCRCDSVRQHHSR